MSAFEQESTYAKKIRRARTRQPIVNVCLKSNPSRMMSVSVPVERDWMTFKERALKKLVVDGEIDEDEREDKSRRVYLEIKRDEGSDEWREVIEIENESFDEDKNDSVIYLADMASIQHKGAIFRISFVEKGIASDSSSSASESIGSNNEADSNEIPEEIDEETNGVPVDLFGRWTHRVAIHEKRRKKRSKEQRGQKYQKKLKKGADNLKSSDQKQSPGKVGKRRRARAMAMHSYSRETLLKIGRDPKEIYKEWRDKGELTNGELVDDTVIFKDDSWQIHLKSCLFNPAEPFKFNLNTVESDWKWAILICHGGKFAGAIYHGSQMIAHKTFSRYVIRKQQGKRQFNYTGGAMGRGTRVNTSGGMKRLASEMKLKSEIHRLMTHWEGLGYWEGLNKIFIHAPGPFNQATLFGHPSEKIHPHTGKGKVSAHWKEAGETFRLDKGDTRIEKIPMTTHQVNLNEIGRVHRFLSTIHFSQI